MISEKQINQNHKDQYDLYDFKDMVQIKYTDFRVIAIDESKGLVYAQYDYGKPSWDAIRDVTSYGYSIVGVLENVIDEIECDEHIQQLIDDETVFILKVGGARYE